MRPVGGRPCWRVVAYGLVWEAVYVRASRWPRFIERTRRTAPGPIRATREAQPIADGLEPSDAECGWPPPRPSAGSLADRSGTTGPIPTFPGNSHAHSHRSPRQTAGDIRHGTSEAHK